MLKFNNQVIVTLTKQEINFLFDLMNEKFEVDNIEDAIKYCIKQQINSFEKKLSEN